MAKAAIGTEPAVKRCIDAYHAAFLARFGCKPLIMGGKDGTLVKKLVATWGEADVLDLLGRFFRSTDPRVVRSDYSLGAFSACAQHLKIGTRPDPRTAQNFDAVSRAMEPNK